MRFVLDNGLPRNAVSLLAVAGHDVVHVGAIGLSHASDDLIIDLAADQQRVVVTLDADFHRVLALRELSRPSVIRLRVEGLKAEPLVRLLGIVLAQYEEQLTNGAAVTVTEEQVRCRMLPFS